MRLRDKTMLLKHWDVFSFNLNVTEGYGFSRYFNTRAYHFNGGKNDEHI